MSRILYCDTLDGQTAAETDGAYRTWSGVAPEADIKELYNEQRQRLTSNKHPSLYKHLHPTRRAFPLRLLPLKVLLTDKYAIRATFDLTWSPEQNNCCCDIKFLNGSFDCASNRNAFTNK
jgi:hypothetical protein